MATDRNLTRLARDAEDCASGLLPFKDSLPNRSTHITAILSELFAISTALQQLGQAHGDHVFQPSWFRIRNNLALVVPALELTFKAIFDSFGRVRTLSYARVWTDLEYRMEREEGMVLVERLEMFRTFVLALMGVLEGSPNPNLMVLQDDIVRLLDRQEDYESRTQRRAIRDSPAEIPRPRPRVLPRIQSYTVDTMPMSPGSESDSWFGNDRGYAPPYAPEPPLGVPLSPTFTSSSSQSLGSSHTSYSSGPYRPSLIPEHWAARIFDGSYPGTPFRSGYQKHDPSECFGKPDPQALQRLHTDGFQMLLELPFDNAALSVRLYHHPTTLRARILITTPSPSPRPIHHCLPLTSLKLIRDKSLLHLCRRSSATHTYTYTLWARLNFLLHERLVLFYSTFVALKAQDPHPLAPELLDTAELREEEEFGGELVHGHLRHALRLFRDRGSGVLRLEASPLRGPYRDVPVWTAFLDRYRYDPAHFEVEGRRGSGVVSVAALRPRPFVFCEGFEVEVNGEGGFLLRFSSSGDATEFVQLWNGLCRGAR